MRRSVLAVAMVLVSSGCVSSELAWCSSSAPVMNRFGSTNARAVEVLQAAERLEGSALGPAGLPSCVVAAYRHVIRQPHAAAIFKNLLQRSTPAGKIYALAGLYETDPVQFIELAATAEASSPGTFERLDTCIATRPTRAEVFAQLRAGDLSAWWRPPSP